MFAFPVVLLLSSGAIAAERVKPAARVATSPDLANMAFSGIEEAGARILLQRGRWQGRPFKGSETYPMVSLLPTMQPHGDLDGDGSDEHVALLNANAGGTGQMLYLAVVGLTRGRWSQRAITPVGDRVQLRRVAIEGGAIRMEVVQAGAEDAMCCPGDLVTRRWTLAKGKLVEGTSASSGRLSAATLGEEEWRLTGWDVEEAYAGEPVVTIAFKDGQFGGRSGCNRYTVGVKDGESVGSLVVSDDAAVTRMACPDAVEAVEQRFLKALAAADRIQFWNGRLGLGYRSGDRYSLLLFEPLAGAR